MQTLNDLSPSVASNSGSNSYRYSENNNLHFHSAVSSVLHLAHTPFSIFRCASWKSNVLPAANWSMLATNWFRNQIGNPDVQKVYNPHHQFLSIAKNTE